MGVFSTATKSSRVASLEASKQIREESAKRRRVPKTRDSNQEIGDTIVVSVPNLHERHINLRGRGVRSLMTSVCVPLSPTSMSPPPRKRKASEFGDDNLTTKAGRSAKRRSSLAYGKSPNQGDPQNLTPPESPRVVASQHVDLEEDERSQSVNKPTDWAGPNIPWIGLVEEDNCANSQTTATATQSSKPDSPLDTIVLHRHSRQDGEDLRKCPALPATEYRGSKKKGRIKDVATAKSLQDHQLADGSDDECGAFITVTPSPRCTSPNSVASDAHYVSRATPETSPPSPLLTNVALAPTTPSALANKRATLSPEVDVSPLSPRSDEVVVEEPVTDAGAVAGEVEQGRSPQRDVALVVDHQEAQVSSPKAQSEDDAPGGEVSDEHDDRGDQMDGVEFSDEAQDAIPSLPEKDGPHGQDKVDGSPTDTTSALETVDAISTLENVDTVFTLETADAISTLEAAEAIIKLEAADAITTLETVDAISTLENVDTVSTLETADTTSTLETVDAISTLENVDTVSTLETADAISTLEAAEAIIKLGAADAITRLKPVDTVSTFGTVDTTSTLETSTLEAADAIIKLEPVDTVSTFGTVDTISTLETSTLEAADAIIKLEDADAIIKLETVDAAPTLDAVNTASILRTTYTTSVLWTAVGGTPIRPATTRRKTKTPKPQSRRRSTKNIGNTKKANDTNSMPPPPRPTPRTSCPAPRPYPTKEPQPFALNFTQPGRGHGHKPPAPPPSPAPVAAESRARISIGDLLNRG
ncbi:MAG: hypothetical protein M1839_008061 [Geoglossum umbratile]|nr:MAG: hypothetical protein M1839_008061 [Geoglossum umbratile]